MSRSAHAWLVAALLAGSAVASTMSAATAGDRPGSTTSESLTHRYRYGGSGSERHAREQSLRDSVAAMNPLYREVASTRLRKNNPISTEVHIDVADGMATVSIPGARPLRAPTDGRSVRWVNREGTSMKLRHRLREDRLVQTIEGTHGTKRVTYSFDDSGRSLSIRITITSKYLPKPIRYRLTYRAIE